MKSAEVPTVFIVNDDCGMRQAIQDLVGSVGLRAEAFATGQDFLRKQRTSDPSCLVLDVRLPQMSGLDLQRPRANPHHLYYGAWRHPNVCQGIEVGRRGILDETIQAPGSPGRNSTSSAA